MVGDACSWTVYAFLPIRGVELDRPLSPGGTHTIHAFLPSGLLPRFYGITGVLSPTPTAQYRMTSSRICDTTGGSPHLPTFPSAQHFHFGGI